MSSAPRLATPALEGGFVRLDPLSLAAVPALLDAASEDRSSSGFTRVPSGPETVRAFVCVSDAACDGKPHTADPRHPVLAAHQKIAVEYRQRGQVAAPPSNYKFPSGV